MTVDTKQMIAEAVQTLLMKHHVRKLTVKDIVEQCHITRQTFYYHFDGIPELLRWMIERRTEQMLQETLTREISEEGLRSFFLMAVHAMPYVEQGMNSNYSRELEELLSRYIRYFFSRVSESRNFYPDCTRSEVNVILRYHSEAIMGLLRGWTERDTEQLDQIVQTVWRIVTEGIPLERKPEEKPE